MDETMLRYSLTSSSVPLQPSVGAGGFHASASTSIDSSMAAAMPWSCGGMI